MAEEESPKLAEYFDSIEKEVKHAYSICDAARKRGIDPEDSVGIPLAKNMAERVEGLISVAQPQIKNSGISKRISDLEAIHGKLSWKVAFIASLETAQEKFCKFKDKQEAMETGIRVGLAYLTLGIVASPLEGFVELKLKKRMDNGQEYFCLMFSGPIRSAGGTGAAVSVLVADYIRRQMGYAQYDATENEAKRGVTELYDYHERVTNLQYLPSEEEIEYMIKNMPIQVDGDGSEKMEVSNYKDLPRIETNIIRNGFCLVIGECLCQKSQKIWKQLSVWGKDFQMDQWNFMEEFLKIQKKKKAKAAGDKKSDVAIQPDYTYIKDLVAGRPILGFPLRNGSFRLRYGRCRNTGYSSAALHPALTYILDKYIAVGTQLKVERPGKAASMSTCDSIEGPLVKLKDGSVVRVNDVPLAKRVASEVTEIIYLGDILFNYGDFFNRAHPLVPAGYCEEWWTQELKKSAIAKLGSSNDSIDFEQLSLKVNISKERLELISKELFNSTIKGAEALSLTKLLEIPLHPKYTYYWNTLTFDGLTLLLGWLASANILSDGNQVEKMVLKFEETAKRQLELAGVPHQTVANEYVVIMHDDAIVIAEILNNLKQKKLELIEKETNADTISRLSGIKQRDRCGTFIGARMGRPEKAKVRKLDGQPHCLFPVGEEGGRLRCFQSAIEAEAVTSDFPAYICSCGNETVFAVCDKCGEKTKRQYFCKACNSMMDTEKCPRHGKNLTYKNQSIHIKDIYHNTLKQLGLDCSPELVKGVRGTSNREHFPEHLGKGILRAKYNVPVNKDGTTRYDMTQLAITHFKPLEIGTPVSRLRELGYNTDTYGNDLTDENQVVELFPQDIILPACAEMEEGSDDILFRVAQFIDDELVRLYKTQSYYNLKQKTDLVGHLVVALAPHTSAGSIARIIGFSKTQGFYAHPMLHAATRRDCDGDEACVTLLVDALINFSRQYLPNTRGATQDAPLVMTSKLTPSEVDDMVFDIDVCYSYPLEFYEYALQYKKPWELPLDQIGKRLNTPKQYEGMGFTHHTSDINLGVKCSAYKLLPSMEEKLHGQMDIAMKIRAVDEAEVAKTVIEKHFIKDIRGNLRKFSQQQFRCITCNEKFRRPPLLGKCTKCGGNIVFTISEGSIVKYLEPALSLANHYHLPAYLKQSLELTKLRVESIFGKEKEKQEGLGRWFG